MSIIQLPPPPALAGKASGVGNPEVSLRKTDKKLVSGSLVELSHANKRLDIDTGKSAMSLPFDKIALIMFREPILLTQAEIALLLDTTIQEFTVVLPDGSTYQGGCYGTVYDDLGLHLFIQDQAGNLHRVIISDQVIDDFTIHKDQVRVVLGKCNITKKLIEKDFQAGASGTPVRPSMFRANVSIDDETDTAVTDQKAARHQDRC